ncbi:MAG TPA: VOC family protein [Candidatus Kapabacteria bacterium]|nr:VOC family protein [Candidatus Kapabacteria bacterium]
MRTLILLAAAMMLMTLSLVQAQTDPTKSLPADVGAGRIAWFDITTTDLSKAKEFYGKLFGWTFASLQGTDQAVEIVAAGSSIGTIRTADGAISSFNGVVYVQVSDIQAASNKAKELGGMVPPGFPFNLPDGRGAISIVADPSGHPIGMYSRTPIVMKKPASR